MLFNEALSGPEIEQIYQEQNDVGHGGATYHFYHFDGLGSVVALSDSAGDTVQTYEYSVFGQVAAEDPNFTNPFMFTGRRFDFETGLYYYRARYYNPYIGRFLQTDPVGYGYIYCGNNPVVRVDTSGSSWTYPGPIPPPISPDATWMSDPGKPPYPGNWSVYDFFGWYRHGNGAAVTLTGTGLFEEFINHPDIASFISFVIGEAVNLAIGQAERIASSPPFSEVGWGWSTCYHRVKHYDFVPGDWVEPIWDYFQNYRLSVLGKGDFTATITIAVGDTGLAVVWGVMIWWHVNDEFKDPLHWAEDDAEPVEWKWCTPYTIWELWCSSFAGSVWRELPESE